MFHHFLQHHWSMLQWMEFFKQTWLNLSCKMWKQREKEMRKGSPVSIFLLSVVFPEAVFQKTSVFWSVSQIYLVRLPDKQQWMELHLLLLGNSKTQNTVGWKEAVLVLWATCKHSVWSPDWSCGLAFWKGRVCPFPFGRVTLANYSCVLTLTITSCCTARPTPSIHPYKPSCFCLGKQILASPHLEHPETPIFLLASCLIVSVFIDDLFSSHSPLWRFPPSPAEGRRALHVFYLLPAFSPEWTGERTDLGDWALGLCLV